MDNVIKYVLGSIGLIISLFLLQHVFWFLYLGFWDYRVTQMCLDDGGAKVYQSVVLSSDEAQLLGLSAGRVPIPAEGTAKADNFPYVARLESQTLRDGTPRIVKSETTIIRVADDEPLGSRVVYARIGSGAILTFDEVSSFSCMSIESISTDVENQIFQFE